jgi:hypothetical protein
MRKFLLATAAATALAATAASMSGFAQAAATGPSSGIRTAIDDLNVVQDAQFVFGGQRHCWYTRGWNGTGWYRCGYSSRRGHGWGGGEGWNGWHRR